MTHREPPMDALSRREDPALGISERFLQPMIGAGRTTAVVSEPLGEPRATGFVVCHSLGLEQTYLARLEVQLSRALSSAGFPVLRYHGQGYGDSEGVDGVGLASHLRDASDATEILAAATGITALGTIGVRFGGAVAALVADRLVLPLMILIEPMVNGRRYVRQFIRTHLFAEWTARAADDPSAVSRDGPETASITMEDVNRDFETKGWADIRGFRVSRAARDEIAAFDLVADLDRFSGSSLLLGVSRSGQLRADLGRLAERLEDLGAAAAITGLADPDADTFGESNLRLVGGSKRDALSTLTHRLTTHVVDWCLANAAHGARSA